MTDVPPTPGTSGDTPVDVPPGSAPNAILDEGPEPVDAEVADAVDEPVDEAVDEGPEPVDAEVADAVDEPVDEAVDEAVEEADDDVVARGDPTVPLQVGGGSDGGVLPVGPDGSPPRRMPINPRIRDRLLTVRRAQGRRRLKIVLGVVAILAVVALGLGLTRSPFLAVQHVRVTGGTHTSRAAVLGVTALDHHPQMIDVSPGPLKRELLGLPWVASARIRRHWPTTVEIRLRERVPVAQVPGPKGLTAIVDGDGRVLATGPAATAAPSGALPAVTGIGQAGRAGTFLSPGSEARAALSLVVAMQTAVPPASPYQLVGIDRRRDGLLQARLTPHVTVLFGSVDDLDAKLLAVRTVLEQVPLKGFLTLDVRVPTSPALTHQ